MFKRITYFVLAFFTAAGLWAQGIQLPGNDYESDAPNANAPSAASYPDSVSGTTTGPSNTPGSETNSPATPEEEESDVDEGEDLVTIEDDESDDSVAEESETVEDEEETAGVTGSGSDANESGADDDGSVTTSGEYGALGMSGQPEIGTKFFESAGSLHVTSKTKIALASTDNNGPTKTYYSIGDKKKQLYETPISFNNEGNYNVEYHAVDNAGNIENPQIKYIKVDNTPPIIKHQLLTDGKKIGTILPPKTKMVLGAQDTGVGVDTLHVKSQDGFTTYKQPLLLTTGDNLIEAYAVDKLGNKSQTYSFKYFVDGWKPNIQYKFSADITKADDVYIIKGTGSMNITATDSHSGIAGVWVRWGTGFTGQPDKNGFFYFKGLPTGQLLELKIVARDKVGNVRKVKNIRVRIDNKPPETILTVQ